MTMSRLIFSALLAFGALPLSMAPALAQSADAPASAAAPAAKKPSKGEAQALRWFRMLDTDGDGRISQQEAQVAIRLSSRIADYFRDADLNGDGYVTEQEIRTVADRRRAERQARRLREAEQARKAQAAAQAGEPGGGKTSTP